MKGYFRAVAIGILALGLLLVLVSLAVAGQTTSEPVAHAEVVPDDDRGVQVAQEDFEDFLEIDCARCHGRQTPGIVEQYERSGHFAEEVTCQDCHLVEEGSPGASEHPDDVFFVLPRSSAGQCQQCHESEVEEFNMSRHALPAYVAYAGTEALNEAHLEQYQSIPEGGATDTGRARNTLHAMEGPEVTRFACEGCHDVGKPNEDGSVGDCTACHLRHEFNLEQVRKPETCNACHIGPDHPQWEIYQESPHGIAYMTMGHTWNWEVEGEEQTVVDFPAPTCVTCHMSTFGTTDGTHDVGDRLTWFLAAPISSQRPDADDNRENMQGVCMECHAENFVVSFYEDGDALVGAVNDWVAASDLMMQQLRDNDLVSSDPFDEPLDYTYFNIWHHWGRTAKFGAWMQGADYVQWHGAYEIMHDLSEFREQVDDKLEEAGLEPLELPQGFPSIDAAREYISESE